MPIPTTATISANSATDAAVKSVRSDFRKDLMTLNSQYHFPNP